MGGVLPVHPQRVLGIGGTAGMVHPSTGATQDASVVSVEYSVEAASSVSSACHLGLWISRDRQTDRQTHRQTDRQTGMHSLSHADFSLCVCGCGCGRGLCHVLSQAS